MPARLLAALVCATAALTALGPENILVIANRQSGASRDIAEHYMRRRAVPPAQLCLLNLEPTEQIARPHYERQVEAPVRACLDRLGPVPIHALVTTLGVPLHIIGSAGIEGTHASVDSELALLPRKRRGQALRLEGQMTNLFYRRAEAPFSPAAFQMYLVARLAAYDVATVKRMIESCLAATNRGRFLLDMRSSNSETEGDAELWDAALRLPRHRVVLEQTEAVATGQGDLIAYASWGSNDNRRKARRLGLGFLPGAIATEFVSTNGRTFVRPPPSWTFGAWSNPKSYHAGSPQSLTADLLDEGASGAAGHTGEPYLHLTPHPDWVFPAYHAGRTLAESFWIGIPALSWTNIVVGDPLCRLGPPPEGSPATQRKGKR